MATQIFQPPHGSPAWFHGQIKRAEKAAEPLVEIVEVSPALASEMLKNNPDNRSIRRTKVSQYSADMANGRWAMNGEPIIVSRDGRLNDGQHRCMAVIDANASVPMILMFGIERETRLTVDQGGARTAGDFLSMEDVPNSSLVAAIARMAIAFESNAGRSLAGAHAITSAQVRERAHADAAIASSARFGGTNGHYSKAFVGGSVVGFCHYVLSRVDPTDAEMFLARICRGDGLQIKSAAHTLREKLQEAGRLPRDRKVKMILQAWTFHRRHMKVGRGSINSELPFPALV